VPSNKPYPAAAVLPHTCRIGQAVTYPRTGDTHRVLGSSRDSDSAAEDKAPSLHWRPPSIHHGCGRVHEREPRKKAE